MRTTTRLLAVLGTLVLSATLTAPPGPGSASSDRGRPATGRDTAAVDWDAQLYYGRHRSGTPIFYVPSSSGTFSATSSLPPVADSFDHTTPESWDHPLQALWSAGCTQDTQLRRFSRRVYLPGTVGPVHFNLRSVTAPQTRKNPIAWAEILVDGHQVARMDRDHTQPNHWNSVVEESFTFRQDQATKITIVAKKAETKRAWGYCNPAPNFGIAASVVGYPRTGLSLQEDSVNVTTTGADLHFSLTNAGPSDAVPFSGNPGVNNSSFLLRTGRDEVGTNVTAVTMQGVDPFQGGAAITCTPSSSDPFELSCALPVVHASWWVGFTVNIAWTPAEPCAFEVPVTVADYHPWDQNPLDNQLSWVLRTPDCPG